MTGARFARSICAIALTLLSLGGAATPAAANCPATSDAAEGSKL